MTLHHLLHFLRRSTTFAFAAKQGPSAAANSTVSADHLPELDPQDIQAAMGQHLAWCRLFNEHLGADPEDLPALAELPNADDSDLGRWITRISHGPGGGHPLLAELAQENRRVHRVALQALDYARSQRLDLASQLLNQAFERSHQRVLEILRQLQKR